jgi:hypothetical protein
VPRPRSSAPAALAPTSSSSSAPAALAPTSSSSSSASASTPAPRAPHARDGVQPYVSGYPAAGVPCGLWRERFAGVCARCFGPPPAVCGHYPELPLNLLLVGHNPSLHAFASGYFYSNPTNNMWPLLTGAFGAAKHGAYAGVVPAPWPIPAQDGAPLHLGVGFTDLGVEPGNDAAAYGPAVLRAWRKELYAALAGHVRRTGATLMRLQAVAEEGGSGGSGSGTGRKRKREDEGSDSSGSGSINIGSDAGFPVQDADTARRLLHALAAARGASPAPAGSPPPPAACAPRVVAFTGKAQWKCLFDPPLATAEVGLQPAGLRPPGWPLPPATGVFLLPSSSGRAAMTTEARRAPYEELGALARAMPWLPPDLGTALEVEPGRAGWAAAAAAARGGGGGGGGGRAGT